MTKEDLCKQDLFLTGKVFDYAVPQEWLNDIKDITEQYRPDLFVWLYDEKAPIFGRPYALVSQGWELLANYYHQKLKKMARYYEGDYNLLELMK